MFDDPKKALELLEEELQTIEKTDDAFERFYSELYEEFGPKAAEEETPEDLLEDVPVRRIPGPYDNKKASRSDYADHRTVQPVRKHKSNAPLVLLIILECLGIAGVVAWWVMRLL